MPTCNPVGLANARISTGYHAQKSPQSLTSTGYFSNSTSSSVSNSHFSLLIELESELPNFESARMCIKWLMYWIKDKLRPSRGPCLPLCKNFGKAKGYMWLCKTNDKPHVYMWLSSTCDIYDFTHTRILFFAKKKGGGGCTTMRSSWFVYPSPQRWTKVDTP